MTLILVPPPPFFQRCALGKPPNTSEPWFSFKILFIYLREKEKHELGEGEEETDTVLRRETDLGLDPRTWDPDLT